MSSYPPTDVRRGIALMVLTALLFIAVDSVAKHLTQRYSIVEVVWARFSFHALFVAILIRGNLRLHLRTRRLTLQLARSFLMLATTALFFAGLRSLALVDAVSIIKALSLAPVSTIAPFAYTNLIWSVSIGYLAFAELPDRWTLFGAGIIIASALYVFQRERKLKALARILHQEPG